MNRRSFFKRAAGMGAVVAGIAALPKGEAKAANAATGAWTGRVTRYVRNTPAPQIVEAGYLSDDGAQQFARVWQETHSRPVVVEYRSDADMHISTTMMDSSTSGPIPRFYWSFNPSEPTRYWGDAPFCEEQALTSQVAANEAALREYDQAHRFATSAGFTATEAHAIVLRAWKAARG